MYVLLIAGVEAWQGSSMYVLLIAGVEAWQGSSIYILLIAGVEARQGSGKGRERKGLDLGKGYLESR